MNRIRPQKFVHVVYRTRRFDRMIEWYKTVFDAKVQFANPAIAFLTYDDEHHRVAMANLSIMAPDAPDVPRMPGAVGVDHVAYTYASLRDLLENYVQLKALGISPFWCLHHGVTISLYYGDPDGNHMEFQVDSYDTPEGANAYMAGPSYAANPIGVEFDPDDMLAKLRAGAPESDFLVRTADTPVSPIRQATVQ